MRFTHTFTGISGMARGLEDQSAAAITRAMRRGTALLLDDIREETQVAFPSSNRLPMAWRGQTFPQSRDSLDATSWVSSRAAKIITAFTRSTTIRARNKIWLAIPVGERTPFGGMTSAGRAAGAYGLRDGASSGAFARRGNRDVVTPASFQRRTGLKLRFVPSRRPDRARLVVHRARRDRTGIARPYSRRGRGSKLYGPNGQTITVFVLVREVRLRKRLDLMTVAERGAARIPSLIDQEFR